MTGKELGQQPAAPVLNGFFDGSGRWQSVECYQGLTKREAFAMSCLAGAMTNADIDSMDADGCAEVAVKLADALLAELAKEA